MAFTNRDKQDIQQLIRNAEDQLLSAKELMQKLRAEGLTQLDAERRLRHAQSKLDALKRVIA